MTAHDDDFTELRDADIPRVDLVDKAANGLTFLIAKREDGGTGLIDAAYVRELVGKADPEPNPDDAVTMTGSPAAIAKLIHQAALRRTEPVTKTDTGVEAPENPAADGSPTEGMAKAMDTDDTTGRLDPTTALAEPAGPHDGDPDEPGSPAWEAIDAATACKWAAILARAKNALALLAERELLEGTADDAMQAMGLQDAACAVDYAISVLAPFAVAEQAEADCADDMAALGKALDGFDSQTLDTIEALSTITKAGRVLSTANEAAIRGAVDSLQKVLASLPAAPTTEDDSGQPVAKEAPVADTAQLADDTTSGNLAKADEETKTPQVAVYDKKGRLVGVVAPDEIVPIATNDEDEEDEPSDDGSDAGEPAEEAPADQVLDLTPQPADEAGTPADDVAKQTDTDTTADTFKSIATDIAKGVLDNYSATQEQVIAKQAETIAQLADVVETLKGQVRALEEQPAAPRVFTNGAIPPAHHMRGQDAGTTPIDVARARELKKGLYGGPDSHAQNTIATELQEMAIARLSEIHNGGARQ
jgi:hypothetical protein